jgi:hypothetical protein
MLFRLFSVLFPRGKLRDVPLDEKHQKSRASEKKAKNFLVWLK